MTTITHTTNVNRGHDRVKLEAALGADGNAVIVWAAHYHRGALKGAGPSLAGLGGDLLHDCEMRLVSLFAGSMHWREVAAA